jgi:transposase
VIRLVELVMILDLHRQGLSVSAIAPQLDRDRKTVRKYIERDLAAPAYGPREPRPSVVAPFAPYPAGSDRRLPRADAGGYSAVKDFLRTIRPRALQAFEALDGVPAEILYDRMKTAVLGEVDDQGIAYNRKLLDLVAHYRFLPKACPPYRVKTEGKSLPRPAPGAP